MMTISDKIYVRWSSSYQFFTTATFIQFMVYLPEIKPLDYHSGLAKTDTIFIFNVLFGFVSYSYLSKIYFGDDLSNTKQIVKAFNRITCNIL